MHRFSRQHALTIGFVTLIIVLWQTLVPASPFIATPAQVVKKLPDVMPRYLPNLSTTLLEFLNAFILSIVFGVLIGLALGYNKFMHNTFNPVIGLGLVTPKAVFIPLVMLWFGLGYRSIVLFGTVLGIFPIITNTMAGLETVKEDYYRLARAIGLNSVRTFTKIIVRAISSELFSGLYLGSTLTMIGVLIMEMQYSRQGVGPLLLLYSSLLDAGSLYAASILTSMISLAVSGTLWYASRRLETWKLQ